MSIMLGDLVKKFGGKLIGDPKSFVNGIAPLKLAGKSQISFLSNSRLKSEARQSNALAIILHEENLEETLLTYKGYFIVTENPYAYYARVAQFFENIKIEPVNGEIHSTAIIHSSAKISKTSLIGPYVVIESGAEVGDRCVIGAKSFIGKNSKIGFETYLFPNSNFLSDCQIGNRCIIQSGAVIGGEGFGFANDKGLWLKIPQTGKVIIGNDVEIGCNTTIDKGALEDTIIEDGVKLDNQIQIAHNCKIGAHTAIAGCVGIAGSAKIGKFCTFGGAAMVLGHLEITDHVHVSSGSLVTKSINEPGGYTGFYPILKHEDWEKSAVLIKQLDTMRNKIKELEKKIK